MALGCSWTAVVLGVLLAVVLSIRFEAPIDVTQPTVRLGDQAYRLKTVDAPVVSGLALRAFEFVATRAGFGAMLRRSLLNSNDVATLRELAAQMPPDLIPLSYPMCRLNRTEREAYDSAVASARSAGTDLAAVLPFITGRAAIAASRGRSASEVDPTAQGGDEAAPASHADAAAAAAAAVSGGALSNSVVLSLHNRFRDGSLTPDAVANQALAATARLQHKYKMFSHEPNTTEILAAARASTARYAAGAPLSIFDGVPVAMKDQVAVAGYVTTLGSAFHRRTGAPAETDDLLVRRFRELGAVLMPPTSMTEGGVTPVGYCVDVAGPFNPHDAAHYSGGSSGGSAVAVGLGLVPVAIGFDGGGSIRTPASWSGVVGLATGFGRLPFESGLMYTVVKSGPLAATVADAALAYAVMAQDPPKGGRAIASTS
jgi:hypothetical protein